MSWEDVDAIRDRQHKLVIQLSLDLVLMGWTLVATDDGMYGARWLVPGDPQEVLWRDGEPEARGRTPEILLATVRALCEFNRKEKAKDKDWACSKCGHKHKGAWLANICVGCDCKQPPPAPTPEQRA